MQDNSRQRIDFHHGLLVSRGLVPRPKARTADGKGANSLQSCDRRPQSTGGEIEVHQFHFRCPVVAHSGNIFGTYLHGAFEDPAVLEVVFGPGDGESDPLERTFQNMAKLVEDHLDTKAIQSWLTDSAQPSSKARLCILTGGVRAGKSTAAQNKALEWGGQNVSVLATAQALDDEMRIRIVNHQNERPAQWETIEEPLHLAAALQGAKHRTVVLDCANLWVTNLLLSPESVDFRQATHDLIQAWRESGKDLIVVTNEVGWGIVPDNALSREFRDQLGWVNQQLVAASTEAWLYVSGAALPLKAPTP